MFYYKTSFSKKAVFLEKTAKNHLWEDLTVLRGSGRLATNINITFFVGVDVLNIFHLATVSKKNNNIFQNNSEKLYLGSMTIFEGTGRQTTKMNIIFFAGKWGTKYSF